jgi:hypothetical protein
MRKKIKKILHALSPHKVDVYVYLFDLKKEIPDLQPRIGLDVEMRERKEFFEKGYAFTARHEGRLANETQLVFSSMLARQLGYKGVPILGNGITFPEFRGNNIHGFMLATILKFYRDKKEQYKVYMFIDTNNHTVMKVMGKLGCERLFRAKVSRLLGIVIKKEILAESV